MRCSVCRTVPNSTYTAVPAAETKAPRIHMTNVIPTLPDELRMILGAAKTLVYNTAVSVSPSRARQTYPVPITRLKMRDAALSNPRRIDNH